MDVTLTLTTHLNLFADQPHPPILEKHFPTVAVSPSRKAVGSAKTKEGHDKEQEHEKESNVYAWLPNSSNTNLIGSDGICGKQVQSTNTPPHNLQGSNYLLLMSW